MENKGLKNLRILITDDVHPILLDGLRNVGAVVTYNPSLTLKDVHDSIHNVDGIVINSKILCDRSLLEKAHNLKFIARLGSGLDIIDLPFAQEQNIVVLNSPEGNRNAVAEHAMAMLLALSNNIISGSKEILNTPWDREKYRGFEWEGKTIGVYGFGNTGRAFAEKWAGFNVEVLAYDKYKEHYVGDHRFIYESTEADLFKKADVMSFHLPLTEETRFMVDRSFFESCKRGVVIVNTSRGQILKTSDLLQGLDSGHLSGACLDVFENEKSASWTPGERALYKNLVNRENVICSPHVAGWTIESIEKIAQALLNKIIAFSQIEDSSK